MVCPKNAVSLTGKINVIHYVKKFKKKNYIISTDAERAFDEIHIHFLLKKKTTKQNN